MAKKALLMILDGWGIGKHNHGDVIFSTPDSKVKVALIPTNEELVIARDTMRIVSEMDN